MDGTVSTSCLGAGWELASSSKRWGPGCQLHLSCRLVMTVAVLVAAQNSGGDCIRPMGKTRGSASKGYVRSKVGMATASLGMARRLSQTT